MSFLTVVGDKSISWTEFDEAVQNKKNKFHKDIIVGFSATISVDLIIHYFACLEAGGVPVFLSHKNFKTKEYIFNERIENWKKLGIKNFYGDFNVLENCPIDTKGVYFIQLSSGTTGNQKGFGIKKQTLLNQLDEYSRLCDLSSESHIVSWLPVYHDMGLITSIFLPHYSRCNVTIIPTFEWTKNPQSLFDEIAKNNATHCWMPNFAFELSLARSLQLTTEGCHFINCAEVCKKETIENFINKYKCTLSSCYAMAENVFCISQKEYSVKDVYNNHVCCGPAINGSSVCLNEDGELLLLGNCLVDFNFEDGSFTPFVSPHPTGDLGILADGQIYVTGRKKEVAKINGVGFQLNEIDYEVNKIIKNGRCVSFEKDSKLIILYELDIDVNLQIQKAIFDNFEIVCEILRVNHDHLIKTSSGKIARHKNVEIYSFYKDLMKVCKNKFDDITWNTALKSDGYIDSFTNMELLTDIAQKTKRKINWMFNFSELNSVLSFARPFVE